MPYRKEKFINGEVYHLIIRGIDKNIIFKDLDDYYRGIFSIYEFNTTKAVVIRDRRSARSHIKMILQKSNRSPHFVPDSRDKLIEILAFCFIPNHIHLLVRQLKDDGIIKFMTKVGIGFGKYFNTKYKRKGYVFQNRFKSVRIQNDDQLKIVWAYIHANPASLIEPAWKENGINDFKKAIGFIENYKWSSYSDYLNKLNFPSVTDRDFVLNTLGGNRKCKELVENYLEYQGRKKDFTDFPLE